MMLSQTAEYALRATAALASCDGRLVPTAELARRAGVPTPYLAKVLQQLATADLIRGRRGVGGGYTLNRPQDEISLFDVINAVSIVRVPTKTEPAADTEEPRDEVIESLENVVREASTNAMKVYQTVTVADLSRSAAERSGSTDGAAPSPSNAGNGATNGSTNASTNGAGGGQANGSSSGFGKATPKARPIEPTGDNIAPNYSFRGSMN